MNELRALRDELLARLERARKRALFHAAVAELERTVDAADRAIVAAALGEIGEIEHALSQIPAWLRDERWHAAKNAKTADHEIAQVFA